MVDIGRNTERDLSVAGYIPWRSKERVPHPGVDGRTVIRGSIDGTRNFESPDHIQLVAREVVSMVLETAKHIQGPEDKIQLVLPEKFKDHVDIIALEVQAETVVYGDEMDVNVI